MDTQTIQKEIQELEKELRDLKTIQGSIKTARGYSWTGKFGSIEEARVNVQITYEDGDIPIIMSWAGSHWITPLKIEGNKQKIHIALYYAQNITFFSTRRILSVERI